MKMNDCDRNMTNLKTMEVLGKRGEGGTGLESKESTL
jgi:hypothetical protein